MPSTQARSGVSAERRSTSLRSNQMFSSHNRPSTSVTSSGSSMSRGSRLRGTTSKRAKDEAQRRAQELRHDVEAAVHVLDNGVNRTPMPLQRRHSLAGMRGGGRDRRESAAGELGSSVFHSSFLMSSDAQSGSSAGWQGGGRRKESSGASMESSMQSLSIAGDMSSHSHPGLRGRGGSYEGTSSASITRAGGALHERMSSAAGVSSLMEPQNLLDGAAYARRTPVTDAERRAWLRVRTSIKLAETPTIFLFERQDETVSNENQYLVEEVQERNELYAELAEAHRVDEGTRFQERGTATFAVAKKSIHCEAHPPRKVDAGGLQVTPWMLKDEFAPLLDDADDDGDDNENEKRGDATNAEGENGDADDGAEDAELGDDVDDETSTQNDDGSTSGRNESVSDQSGRPGSSATRATGDRTGHAEQWMFAESLLSNLRVMERAVVQNILEETQLAYRGIVMGPESSRLGVSTAQPLAPAITTTTTQVREQPQSEVTDAAVIASGEEVDETSPQVLEGTQRTGEAASFPQNDLPPISTSDDVKVLWRYHSPLTRGRAVTCMAWNRKETDILAVGYGPRRATLQDDEYAGTTGGKTAGAEGKWNGTVSNQRTANDQRGMICCWSLKNPLAPELVLHLQADAAVSSLAFSYEHPSLLAVGDTNGGIVVFDIQKDLAAPSIVPGVSTGLHTGAVWALKWVTNGKERGEFLMSISADGRVVQWVVGKTVEKVAPDLMHLKRQPGAQMESAFVEGVAAAEEAAATAAAATAGRRGRKVATSAGRGGSGGSGAVGAAATGNKEDAVLSRQAGGMCFDVCPSDHAIYIVGTEDGSVYQCNKSQTETYDLDYAAHAELVYRVRWSPFSTKYFLTCSADWTTRLYAVGHAPTLIQFDSPNQDAVQDVAWSPSNALYFATVTAQGSVELWGVGDAIYPRATARFHDHRRLNAILFAEQETPVLVVGDDEGDVSVFLLNQDVYGRQDLTDDEQELWLEEAVKKAA